MHANGFRNCKCRQGTALFASIIFVLVTVLQDAAWAFPNVSDSVGTGLVSAREIQATDKGRPYGMLPRAIGTIDESFEGTNGKTIYFIQDAHNSLDAQRHIAALIDHLVIREGVQTVFEEGYEGEVPSDEYFGFIEDASAKEMTAYFLMDQLRIGGAEYAHINRTEEFKLIGADSITLQLENISAYRQAAEAQATIEKDLNEALAKLKKLSQRVFPREFKRWLKSKTKFEHGEASLTDYLATSLALPAWPAGRQNPSSIQHSRHPEAPQPPTLLGRGTGGGTTDFSTRQILRPPRSFAQDDIIGGTSQGSLISVVLMLKDSSGKVIPEKINEIDSRALFEEIEALEQAIVAKLLMSKRDQQLFEYLSALELVKRLSKIDITPSEFEMVEEAIKSIDTRTIVDFLVKETGESLVLSKRWERVIQDALHFYETALKREQRIADTLMNWVTTSEDSAVLVFGGFHTPTIKRLLKDLNFSFHVISPKINEIEKRHQEYYKRLMSVGHHAFEIPIALTQGSRAATTFLRARSNPDAVRAEVRQIARMVRESAGVEDAYRRSLMIRNKLKGKSTFKSTRAEARQELETWQERLENISENGFRWTLRSALELVDYVATAPEGSDHFQRLISLFISFHEGNMIYFDEFDKRITLLDEQDDRNNLLEALMKINFSVVGYQVPWVNIGNAAEIISRSLNEEKDRGKIDRALLTSALNIGFESDLLAGFLDEYMGSQPFTLKNVQLIDETIIYLYRRYSERALLRWIFVRLFRNELVRRTENPIQDIEKYLTQMKTEWHVPGDPSDLIFGKSDFKLFLTESRFDAKVQAMKNAVYAIYELLKNAGTALPRKQSERQERKGRLHVRALQNSIDRDSKVRFLIMNDSAESFNPRVNTQFRPTISSRRPEIATMPSKGSQPRIISGGGFGLFSAQTAIELNDGTLAFVADHTEPDGWKPDATFVVDLPRAQSEKFETVLRAEVRTDPPIVIANEGDTLKLLQHARLMIDAAWKLRPKLPSLYRLRAPLSQNLDELISRTLQFLGSEVLNERYISNVIVFKHVSEAFIEVARPLVDSARADMDEHYWRNLAAALSWIKSSPIAAIRSYIIANQHRLETQLRPTDQHKSLQLVVSAALKDDLHVYVKAFKTAFLSLSVPLVEEITHRYSILLYLAIRFGYSLQEAFRESHFLYVDGHAQLNKTEKFFVATNGRILSNVSWLHSPLLAIGLHGAMNMTGFKPLSNSRYKLRALSSQAALSGMTLELNFDDSVIRPSLADRAEVRLDLGRYLDEWGAADYDHQPEHEDIKEMSDMAALQEYRRRIDAGEDYRVALSQRAVSATRWLHQSTEELVEKARNTYLTLRRALEYDRKDEILFEDFVSSILVPKIASLEGKPRVVVVISGKHGSGKSGYGSQIVSRPRFTPYEQTARAVIFDDFLREREDREPRNTQDPYRKFNIPRYQTFMQKISAKERATKPIYDQTSKGQLKFGRDQAGNAIIFNGNRRITVGVQNDDTFKELEIWTRVKPVWWKVWGWNVLRAIVFVGCFGCVWMLPVNQINRSRQRSVSSRSISEDSFVSGSTSIALEADPDFDTSRSRDTTWVKVEIRNAVHYVGKKFDGSLWLKIPGEDEVELKVGQKEEALEVWDPIEVRPNLGRPGSYGEVVVVEGILALDLPENLIDISIDVDVDAVTRGRRSISRVINRGGTIRDIRSEMDTFAMLGKNEDLIVSRLNKEAFEERGPNTETGNHFRINGRTAAEEILYQYRRGTIQNYHLREFPIVQAIITQIINSDKSAVRDELIAASRISNPYPQAGAFPLPEDAYKKYDYHLVSYAKGRFTIHLIESLFARFTEYFKGRSQRTMNPQLTWTALMVYVYDFDPSPGLRTLFEYFYKVFLHHPKWLEEYREQDYSPEQAVEKIYADMEALIDREYQKASRHNLRRDWERIAFTKFIKHAYSLPFTWEEFDAERAEVRHLKLGLTEFNQSAFQSRSPNEDEVIRAEARSQVKTGKSIWDRLYKYEFPNIKGLLATDILTAPRLILDNLAIVVKRTGFQANHIVQESLQRTFEDLKFNFFSVDLIVDQTKNTAVWDQELSEVHHRIGSSIDQVWWPGQTQEEFFDLVIDYRLTAFPNSDEETALGTYKKWSNQLRPGGIALSLSEMTSWWVETDPENHPRNLRRVMSSIPENLLSDIRPYSVIVHQKTGGEERLEVKHFDLRAEVRVSVLDTVENTLSTGTLFVDYRKMRAEVRTELFALVSRSEIEIVFFNSRDRSITDSKLFRGLKVHFASGDLAEVSQQYVKRRAGVRNVLITSEASALDREIPDGLLVFELLGPTDLWAAASFANGLEWGIDLVGGAYQAVDALLREQVRQYRENLVVGIAA